MGVVIDGWAAGIEGDCGWIVRDERFVCFCDCVVEFEIHCVIVG